MIKNIFYGWWIVLASFVISFYVGSIVFFGFTAFIEPLREEFGWSYAQISFASSLRGLEMGIIAPLVGFLIDRFGSRKLALLGVLSIGFGLIFLSVTQSLAMFYGAILLLAFGAGGCTGVVLMSVVADWFRKKVGKALGFMASGFGASGLMIPYIVWLIDSYNWRTACVILGLGMWVLGIPLSFVIRNKPEQYGYLPDGDLPDDPSPQTEIRANEIGFKDALKSRSFLYLNLVEIIRTMSLSAVIIHIMPYLGNLGMSRSTAGLVAAALPLFSIIGRFGFGWLGDVLEKRLMMAVAFCLMGMGMLAFCYARTGWVIILFLLLYSPGFGGTMILRGSILREYFGRDHFSKMLGIVFGLSAIGGIIGPTLAGWVFDTFGSYDFIWFVFFLLFVPVIMLTLRIKPLHGYMAK